MSGPTDLLVELRVLIDALVPMAHSLGAVEAEALPRETGWLGMSLRTLADGQEVWLVRMGFNWRILETHPNALTYGRYWCYPGIGLQTFTVALQHALSYGDGEPDGWIKAWDGRRGDDLRPATNAPISAVVTMKTRP